MVEGGHRDHDADHAAQGRRERRFTDGPVGRVREHDRVGAQLLAMPFEDRGQRVGPDLLLTLDEDRDPDGQLPRVRPQRRQMGHDPGLVVGRAPAVEPTIAFGRLEGWAVPECVVAGRLHVVVGIEHDGRGSLGPVDVGDDGRSAPSRTISTVRPSASSKAAVASAEASTWAWSKASRDTLGIRARASRSTRTCGMRSCTLARRASTVSADRMSVVGVSLTRPTLGVPGQEVGSSVGA